MPKYPERIIDIIIYEGIMKQLVLFFVPLSLCIQSLCFGDNVIWSGTVNSDGSPSKAIPLETGKQYQIKAVGAVKLGNWKKNGEELSSDPCYLFGSDPESVTKTKSLRNSADIDVCDGKYHLNHVYLSFPFTATQERIHFWIHDSIYNDNSGTFSVEILEINHSS